MPDTKIATCSYCGRRQALRMTARGGHELACGSCGAPLHEMKWLRPPDPERPVKRSPRAPAPHGGPLPPMPEHRLPQRPVKRRKPLWRRALEEAVDLIEEIFD
jgi:ribosomal protein L34E